jgi:hypothetical protein
MAESRDPALGRWPSQKAGRRQREKYAIFKVVDVRSFIGSHRFYKRLRGDVPQRQLDLRKWQL